MDGHEGEGRLFLLVDRESWGHSVHCEVTSLVSFPLQPQPPRPSNILQTQPLAGPHLGGPVLQPQPSGVPLQLQPSGDLLLGEPVLQPTASQQEQKVKGV